MKKILDCIIALSFIIILAYSCKKKNTNAFVYENSGKLNSMPLETFRTDSLPDFCGLYHNQFLKYAYENIRDSFGMPFTIDTFNNEYKNLCENYRAQTYFSYLPSNNSYLQAVHMRDTCYSLMDLDSNANGFSTSPHILLDTFTNRFLRLPSVTTSVFDKLIIDSIRIYCNSFLSSSITMVQFENAINGLNTYWYTYHLPIITKENGLTSGVLLGITKYSLAYWKQFDDSKGVGIVNRPAWVVWDLVSGLGDMGWYIVDRFVTGTWSSASMGDICYDGLKGAITGSVGQVWGAKIWKMLTN